MGLLSAGGGEGAPERDWALRAHLEEMWEQGLRPQLAPDGEYGAERARPFALTLSERLWRKGLILPWGRNTSEKSVTSEIGVLQGNGEPEDRSGGGSPA